MNSKLPPTFEQIKQFLLNKYSVALAARGLAIHSVPDSFDLLQEGIIDSLGVLDMINDVEKEFGVQLDMERLDAEQLTILGSFSKFVADSCAPPLNVS